jgi:adenylate cyclase
VVEARKLAAILAADIVGYSRLTSADEDRTLARLRALRSDLIDPTIAIYRGRVVKRTGDGAIVEFRSAVDAVNCAREIQNRMVERNAGVPDEQRVIFRIGIHVGDVVEEADGDLMGDGVNIAARLEGVAKPGAICLSEDAYRQVKSRPDLRVSDLGLTSLKNIAEPMRVYSVEVEGAALSRPTDAAKAVTATRPMSFARIRVGLAAILLIVAAGGVAWRFAGGAWTAAPVALPTSAPEVKPAGDLSIVVLPFANLSNDPAEDYFADGITQNLINDLSRIDGLFIISPNTAFGLEGEGRRRPPDRQGARRPLYSPGLGPARPESCPCDRAIDRRGDRRPSVGRHVREADRRSVRPSGRDCRPACQYAQVEAVC